MGGKRHLAEEDRISELKDRLEKISELKDRRTEMMRKAKKHRKCVGSKGCSINVTIVPGEEDREGQ